PLCYNARSAMPPAGSVVIVTFNSARHIELCLRSVAVPGWERIVVDNASADDTVELARGIPDTLVLANPKNRGFAAGVQQGIRAGWGELVLLLNPDVVAEPGAVAALAEAVKPDGVAAAAGRLLNPDGTTQVGFGVRRFPTLAATLAEVLLLNRLFPRNPWNRRYHCLDFNYDRPATVEQPAGACLLVKRKAWESVGGFDEQFFPLWFEDVDFCRRLQANGWRIVYEPRARFRHAGGHSLAGLELRERQLHWYCNLLRYFRKHHGLLPVAVLRLGILLGMLLRIVATLLGVAPEVVARRVGVGAYALVIRRCVLGKGMSLAARSSAQE
ncbi:MAG: glycosyltransferase family 2 protein, partial [Terriglobia bacterium]